MDFKQNSVYPNTVQQPQQTLYGSEPVMTTCPSCHERRMTSVNYKASTKTHLIAVLLCGIACCCIPYCINSCKSAEHICGNCGAYLGTHKN